MKFVVRTTNNIYLKNYKLRTRMKLCEFINSSTDIRKQSQSLCWGEIRSTVLGERDIGKPDMDMECDKTMHFYFFKAGFYFYMKEKTRKTT